MSFPVYGFKTNIGSLEGFELDRLNKWYDTSSLVGFILNSTVLAEDERASVKEEDQSVFIK